MLEDTLAKIRQQREEIGEIVNNKKKASELNSNEWKSVIIRVDDVKLISFLKKEYPDVWNSFKEKMVQEEKSE
ncbi:MAG: hypothetical protein ACRC0V_11575 [Fusobacteriaceae bacterium]